METASPAPAGPLPPVGFVGTGMMGSRLAGRLLRAGVTVHVHNRTRSKAEPLIVQGARWADRPADVARAVPGGILFVMVTDGRAVRQVLFGRGGMRSSASPGSLVVDLSTIDPDESRAFSETLRARGVGFVDAPVGGSIGPAERGELTFFVGGEAADVERVRPYFEVLGRRVVPMGPVGAGTSMKLVNNLLTLTTVSLLGEALALGEALGLDRSRMVEILRGSGAASRMLENKAGALAQRTYPAEFLLSLAYKDLKLAEGAARRAGRAAPLAREARRLFARSIADGHADEDFSAVAETSRSARRPAASIRPATRAPDPPTGRSSA